MNILVPIQLVPDLVEELVVAGDGKNLDPDSIRWTINEFDDHSIEQAILLKEKHGGVVTILAPDYEGVDDILYQAAAKGADRLVKLTGDLQGRLDTHALARLIVRFISSVVEVPDLILTGVKAHNSLDGSLGPILAASLNFPFIDCVAYTAIENQKAVVHKEYPEGLVAEMEVMLPAVLGIQAANTPPRYVPISRMRQAMKSCSVEEEGIAELEPSSGLEKTRMYPPDMAEWAEMLAGDVDQVADQLVSILIKLNVL